MHFSFNLLVIFLLWVAAPALAQWSSVDGFVSGDPDGSVALDQSAPPREEDLPTVAADPAVPGKVQSDLESLTRTLATRDAVVSRTPDPTLNTAQKATPLSPREVAFAQTAWRYFQTTTDAKTGLVRSTLRFPSTTLWDQGGYFIALVSAYRLGLVSRLDAVARASMALRSLYNMPLNNGIFPNKAYNTETLEMTDYANKVVANGIGYSALDIMRLISGMVALEQAFPEVAAFSKSVRGKWPLHDLILHGRFYSTTTVGERSKGLRQEGRIGYEQYAARVAVHIGLDANLAMSFASILRWQAHDGIMIPGDRRLASTHGIDPVTTSEPFILEALEYGWRPEARAVAMAVFAAQFKRFQTTGKLTSLSEDHIAGAPYFAYGGILVGERPFETVTPGRKVVNGKRSISTKASFGWWVLTNHDYGALLVQALEDLRTEHGWQAGLFETDLSPNTIVTLNTNAVVLQALHYKAFGPIIRDVHAHPAHSNSAGE
ncbi:MAG: DUF3131 domain-containing protein [Pseudomonadota bacterium]